MSSGCYVSVSVSPLLPIATNSSFKTTFDLLRHIVCSELLEIRNTWTTHARRGEYLDTFHPGTSC